MQILSARLKTLRQSKQQTQKEVADGSGLHVNAYQKYELNRGNPDLDTLLKLADYFNVTTDYLLGRTDNSN